MNVKTIWLAILASLLVISCSKEAGLPEVKENSELPDVFVENGVLNIKNQEVFENLVISNSKGKYKISKIYQ